MWNFIRRLITKFTTFELVRGAILVILIIATIVSLRYCKSSPPIVIGDNPTIHNTDSTSFYKAKVEAVTLDNLNLLSDIETKNKNLQQLQTIIKKAKSENVNLNAVIIHQTALLSIYTDSLENVIVYYDSLFLSGNDSLIIYPVYHKRIVEPVDTVRFKFAPFPNWIEEDIRIGRFSTRRSLKVMNIYEITLGTERQGMFKAPRYYAYVNSLNPFDNTIAIRSYVEAPKKDNFWLYIGLGLSFLVGGLLL